MASIQQERVIDTLKSTTEAIASIYLFFLLVLYFPSLEICNLVFQDPPLFLNLFLLLGDSDLHIVEAGIKLKLQESKKKKILQSNLSSRNQENCFVTKYEFHVIKIFS